MKWSHTGLIVGAFLGAVIALHIHPIIIDVIMVSYGPDGISLCERDPSQLPCQTQTDQKIVIGAAGAKYGALLGLVIGTIIQILFSSPQVDPVDYKELWLKVLNMEEEQLES